MFAPSQFLFILSFVYISVIFLIWLFFVFNKPKFTNSNSTVFFIILLAFILRLFAVFAFPFGSGYDINSFLWAGEQIIHKTDLYWGLDIRYHYSFLPTFGMLVSIFIPLSKIVGIQTYLIIKTFIIIFDSFIPFILYKLTQKANLSFLYALSPIPILVCAYFGQFDCIVLFFLLFAFYFFRQNNFFRSYLFLGISFCIKPWPILFLPVLILRKSQNWYAFFIAPLILLFIYKFLIPNGNLLTMLQAIVSYESSVGWYGPSILFFRFAHLVNRRGIIPFSALVSKISTIFILLIMFIKTRKLIIFDEVKIILLLVYVFSFGLAIQYFLWIFPFILITEDKILNYFSIIVGSYYVVVGTFHILTFGYNPPGIPVIYLDVLSFLLWLFFVFYLIKVVRQVGVFSKMRKTKTN